MVENFRKATTGKIGNAGSTTIKSTILSRVYHPSPNQLLYMNQSQYPLPTADDARLAHVIWDKLAQVAIGGAEYNTPER